MADKVTRRGKRLTKRQKQIEELMFGPSPVFHGPEGTTLIKPTDAKTKKAIQRWLIPNKKKK